jgi:hypothetical protein
MMFAHAVAKDSHGRLPIM